jgi:hypothetical protein
LNSNKIKRKGTSGFQYDYTYVESNLFEVGCELHGVAVYDALGENL